VLDINACSVYINNVYDIVAILKSAAEAYVPKYKSILSFGRLRNWTA